MTYTIMTPVYGIPLRTNTAKKIQLSDKLKELLYGDNEEKGFLCFYSGSGESPIALGVVVGKDLDECCNHIEVTSFVLTAPEDKIEKFNALYDKIDKDLQEEILQFGKPRVFYLVSSS